MNYDTAISTKINIMFLGLLVINVYRVSIGSTIINLLERLQHAENMEQIDPSTICPTSHIQDVVI